MSLAILFHFLCAQHISDINISFTSSLRLFCWITKLVVLFLVRCVLEFRCGWVGVVVVLQAEPCNMFWTLIYPSSGACDYSAELPHWSIVLGSMCVGVSVWLGWSGIRVAAWSKNNTTNVVIQQNSRKLLMMDILISETCWAHKKWNKIASDIKLVFYSSTNSSLYCCHQTVATLHYKPEHCNPLKLHICLLVV